jgi:GAF domain-containing protein/HAMP domain-containing protein
MQQQGTNSVSNFAEKRRLESVKTISLLGALGSWIAVFVAVVAYLLPGSQQGDLPYIPLIVIGSLMAACLTIANLLGHRNKLNFATWLSIFATEVIFITISFTVANLGIILAIILLIIIGSLTLQTLSSKAAIIAIATGITTSIITFLIDILNIFSLNHVRIIPPDQLIGIIVVASGIIILILGIELLSHYQFNSIRSQIIVAFIIISVVPLWTVAIPQLILTSSSLQKNGYESVVNSTRDIAENFDDVLTHLKDNNEINAELPVFVKFIQDGSEGQPNDILKYFQAVKKRNSNILSYSLMDTSGKIIVSTTPNQVQTTDKNIVIDFQNTSPNNKSSISDIHFDQFIKKHVFYIDSPILNSDSVIGLLRIEVNADFLQTESVKQATAQGKDLTVILIDQNGIILANSSSDKTLFKLIAPIEQDQLLALQKEYVLSSGALEDLSLNLLDLQNNLNKNSNFAFQTTLTSNNGDTNVVAYANTMNNKSWKVIVGRPISWFAEPANTQTRITILIATIIMLIALAVAIITSNLLTSPLNYLTSSSERINQGELDLAKILERNDEIGRLGKAVNKTTLKLNEALETIESQVDRRTLDLTTAKENSGQQADQLRSIVEITRTITSIQSINQLLPEITRQISIVFGFYHVAIFLTDQTGHYTVLQAANSIGGQKMLERGYQVRVGDTDRVGFVTSSGQTHVTTDVNRETTVFDNPDLPNTHSSIVIPLQIGENIIGALDLQSDKNMVFSPDSINSFNLLANQVSIAIYNAELFEETRNALVEAQAFYRQSATASWRNVLHQGTRGYRYLNGTIEAIKVLDRSPEKTVEKSIEQKNISISDDQESLVIPINIRGKSLGVLNIRQVGRNHSWSNSEIRVYRSIVDRISFALENARLYQDAQKRAAKERVISEIATKVSSSVNMDNILQTAVEELGRVLPGSEIIIQFEHEEDETSSEFRAQE